MNYIEGLLSTFIAAVVSPGTWSVIFDIFSQHLYSEISFLYQPRSIAFPLVRQSVPYKGGKATFCPNTKKIPALGRIL